MREKPVKSTTFRRGYHTSKPAQEQRIAELFTEGYELVTGLKLGAGIKGPDPPDWLFSCLGINMGVEMFEVEQFYDARAFFDDITNKVYDEFDLCPTSTCYEGLVINLGILADTDIKNKVKTRWREKGIIRNPKHLLAKELVSLFTTNVPPRNSVPESDLGLIIPVTPSLYPALSCLAKSIIINRCPKQDPRRTDGRAAPLVIISPGYLLPKDNELTSKLADDMKKKMNKKYRHKSKWQAISHSALIAHELPRGIIYQGGCIEWQKHLKKAADEVKLLTVFNELWFIRPVEIVTAQDSIERKAQFICGKHISFNS